MTQKEQIIGIYLKNYVEKHPVDNRNPDIFLSFLMQLYLTVQKDEKSIPIPFMQNSKEMAEIKKLLTKAGIRYSVNEFLCEFE